MQSEKPRKSLWTLFFSMLYISAFTFGGGFVIVTLMKRRFVDELHWMSDQEMLDMTALAQSAPGGIAVNAAVLVGRYARGFWGMLVSVLATVLPPLVTLSVISYFYQAFASNAWVSALLKGMQAGVVAVIADVICNLGGGYFRDRDLFSIFMMIATFAAAFIGNVNAVYLILIALLIGGTRAALRARRAKR